MPEQKIKSINEIVIETFEQFIPGFWSRSGTNEQLLRGFSGEISELSKKISQVYNQISIETAKNSNLDEFGLLFRLSRNTGESDDLYRNRLKSYFQTFLNSGTVDGIRQSLLLLTQLNEDNIDVVPLEEFNPQQFIANFESTESWTGTGVTDDSTYYYEGAQGKRLTSTGAETITTTLSRSLNLDINKPEDIDAFRIWMHYDDLTKLDSITLSFNDGTTSAALTIPAEELIDNNDFIIFNKNEFINTSAIEWDSITSVSLSVEFNALSYVTFDWLQFGVVSPSLKFGISIEIDDEFDDTLLDAIDDAIDKSKAAGTYYNKDKTFTSRDNLFLVNFSEVNGEDEIL
jgi:hypothetical protein